LAPRPGELDHLDSTAHEHVAGGTLFTVGPVLGNDHRGPARGRHFGNCVLPGMSYDNVGDAQSRPDIIQPAAPT
jgi:hypothetical protein